MKGKPKNKAVVSGGMPDKVGPKISGGMPDRVGPKMGKNSIGVGSKAQAEIKKLNCTAKRAIIKGTPEHKKIFDTHAEAWKELANK